MTVKWYVCNYVGGRFTFQADNRDLALDHAKHHCAVEGYVFHSIRRCFKQTH